MQRNPVGNRIRELRARTGLSQQQLADRVGATRQTINAVELGKYLPTLELAFKLAVAFETDIESVFQHPSRASDEIVDLKTFVPARDYALSQQFYRDLGFKTHFTNNEVTEFQIGGFRFLLQNYYVQEFAGSFMMQLAVTDLDAYWARLHSLDLPTRYRGIMLRAPSMQPWGLRIAYLSDPSGVLWHIAEQSRTPVPAEKNS